MASEIKRNKAFGTATIDHFSPSVDEQVPTALNIRINFEEALKLYLGLGQLLGHLNGYNRKTKAASAPLAIFVFTWKNSESPSWEAWIKWAIVRVLKQLLSRVGCMLGLTIRQSDRKRLLMGQAVLQIHRHVAKEYMPEGYWCGS